MIEIPLADQIAQLDIAINKLRAEIYELGRKKLILKAKLSASQNWQPGQPINQMGYDRD